MNHQEWWNGFVFGMITALLCNWTVISIMSRFIRWRANRWPPPPDRRNRNPLGEGNQRWDGPLGVKPVPPPAPPAPKH